MVVKSLGAFRLLGNSMPEVPRVQKKLRETKFFFGHMSQSARSARLDHDRLEFYLSAFLSAARRVTDFFEHHAWWSQWKASQSASSHPQFFPSAHEVFLGRVFPVSLTRGPWLPLEFPSRGTSYPERESTVGSLAKRRYFAPSSSRPLQLKPL